jgi:hypothetical protein
MAPKSKRKKSRRQSREARLNAPARARALDALSRMRTEGLSMSKAAVRAETSVKSIIKYVGRALKKNAVGRYQAKPADRLIRVINFYADGGPIEITVKSSRTASEVSRHLTAVKQFLKTGDASGLVEFEGKTVKIGGISYPFVTDLDLLERLQDAVSFEDLYANIN